MSDGLESRILSQLEQATHDSHGRLTLDRRHALKKLRAHLLPSPSFWILKVVQAAVANGASALEVTHTGSTTEITFRSTWTLDHVESAFLESTDGTDRGLNHLKRGLGSLTTQVDGFVLATGGEGLSWSAAGVQRLDRPGQNLLLTVQHANVDGPWLKAIRHELASRAHTCPIPLTYNGERLDDLSRDVNHPDYNAFFMGVVDLEGFPSLGIAPATYERKAGRLGALQIPAERPRRASAACVLHLGEKDERRLSLIHWVLDGVMVCSQLLHAKGHDSWCNLYASAADLPLDLGGFRLSETTRSAGIAYEISRAFYPQLAALRIDFSQSIQRRRKTNRRAGTACLLIGASVMWTGPIGLGVGLLACVAALATTRDDGGREEERTLREGFLQLLLSWPGAADSKPS